MEPQASAMPVEHPVCSIKRHPIGIIGIYVGAILLVIILAVVVFAFIPREVTDPSTDERVTKIADVAFVILTAAIAIFVYISHLIYWENSWTVTTDSITQVCQNSLFDRQTSQLSFEHLEDVTTEQHGPLSHMFNYGLLRVETASDSGKYVFLYCPKPDYYAQQIRAARERYEQRVKGEGQPPEYIPPEPIETDFAGLG